MFFLELSKSSEGGPVLLEDRAYFALFRYAI